MRAYCFASGQIEFGRSIPDGALPIAVGPSQKLRDFIEPVARHGYHTRLIKGRPTKIPGTDSLLVPGIPEATDQERALDALHAWLDWMKDQAPKGVSVL